MGVAMKQSLLTLALAVGLPMAASAAIIDNGTIQMGVDNFGQLNVPGGTASPVSGTTVVGLRYMANNYEATSHGCLCEGWGVGIKDTMASGSANNDSGGASNLTLVSFTNTASTATSVVTLNGSDLRITHSFAPAAETSNLYAVKVTIENTGATDIADLRYTRTFDWDVEPTTFNEYVTHAGVASTPSVLSAVNNGFVDSNPFGSRSDLGATGDFVDFGPDDQGTNFDFGFGALKAGEAYTFDIFYGAAGNEAMALAALGAVGAELYSFGQSVAADGSPANDATTFIFAFKGVGGTIIVPPSPVPVPAAGFLMLAGLGGLGAMRLRRKAR